MHLSLEIFLKHRRRVIIAFAITLIISLLLIPLISVNYDMRVYLPEDSQTSDSLELLEQTFGISGSAQVMMPASSVQQALEYKNTLQEIEGIKSVFFLDDLADLNQPLGLLDQDQTDVFYKDGQALFTLTFVHDDYSPQTSQALTEIRELLGDEAAMAGPAVRTANMSSSIGKELLIIMAVIIPLFLIILLLFTHSFAEAVLFLVVIGTAVVINIGTNSFFPHISFMTHLSVAVLQLAISMDYSIFLLHRFGEERQTCPDLQTAMVRAVHSAFVPITASALTTMAGFLALIAMRYSLGRDLGLVLSKGILLSLVSVLVLLPLLTLTFIKAIDKTTHRNLLPTFRRSARHTIKLRYVILPIWLALAVFALLAQSSNSFIYGESAIMASEGSRVEQDQVLIEETFGKNNTLLVIVPSGQPSSEFQLAEELMEIPEVTAVQSLAVLSDPAMPRELLPEQAVSQFESGGYSRIILNLATAEESTQAFQAVEQVKAATAAYYPQAVVFGSTTSISDIQQVVEKDYTLVNWLSILAVGLILLFTFKSFLLPVILVVVIESAIWLNMSIPYFSGKPLSFIGYMIVSSVQLGATIDYAILLTSRYRERRLVSSRRMAGREAIELSGGSVLMSSGILTLAGLAVWIVSSIEGIRELGLLIGRGAILSGVMVLFVLPQLLVLLDWLIERSYLTGLIKRFRHGRTASGSIRGQGRRSSKDRQYGSDSPGKPGRQSREPKTGKQPVHTRSVKIKTKPSFSTGGEKK